MKIEKKISLLFLFVATLVTAACGKEETPTAEEKTPVGFRAMSQGVLTKDGEATERDPLSKYHNDFGVWGIARHTLESDYILWEPDAMTVVNKKKDSDSYAPVKEAYWFLGYAYNFLAVAPWEVAENISSITTGSANGADNLNFTYSIADKYEAGNYVFDPMGAAAQTEELTQKPSQQDLAFWHLLSQININVTFVDGDGKPVDSGSVSEIRMNGIDTNVSYTLGFNSNNSLSVACAEASEPEETTIVINTLPSTIHVVPQYITDFEVLVDFNLGGVAYDDFKLNLDIQTEDNPNGKNPAEYEYNGRYDWNIKIGPKGTISFKVNINDWAKQVIPDGDDDDNNDLEII